LNGRRRLSEVSKTNLLATWIRFCYFFFQSTRSNQQQNGLHALNQFVKAGQRIK
jgi:hypothetical protein